MEKEKLPFVKESTSYTFTASHEEWRIMDWSPEYAAIEETRKNGQEDTHMFAEIYVVDGKWTMSNEDRENIIRYSWADEPDSILEHFEKHGTPKEFDPLKRAVEIRDTMGSQLHNPGDMIEHLITELRAGRELTVKEACSARANSE